MRTINDVKGIIEAGNINSPKLIAKLYYQLNRAKRTWEGYTLTVEWIEDVEAKLDDIRIKFEEDNSYLD